MACSDKWKYLVLWEQIGKKLNPCGLKSGITSQLKYERRPGSSLIEGKKKEEGKTLCQVGKQHALRSKGEREHNVRDASEESWGQRTRYDQAREGVGNQVKEPGNDIDGNEGPLKRCTRK